MRLYHGMPSAPVGDALLPGTKYGTAIPAETRATLGFAAAAVHPPLVFASPHLRHATAFATTGQRNAVLFGCYDVAREAYFAIFCDREAFLQATLAGVVHAFPDAGFVPLPGSANHYLGAKPVPFAATEPVLRVRSVADALRTGLQIFTIREPAPRSPTEAVPYDWFRSLAGPEALAPFIAAGKVFWENELQGVAPDPYLRATFHDALKQHS